MPLFQMKGDALSLVKSRNYRSEKELQLIVEKNLETIFNCKFIASEYPTGVKHGGRIDTLALSEDNNPVIIEYKKVESSDLINQSLFYLSWIQDHRGDFQVIVNKVLRKQVDVDWGAVRVICIAPGYKKYDLHAVQMMGANIELWQYRLYENGALYFEEVFRRSEAFMGDTDVRSGKDPKMVAAGKKAALTRLTGTYTIDQHMSNGNKNTKEIAQSIRDYILGISDDIEESPKKFYVAYSVAQNFVCMELRKTKVMLFLKLNPKDVKPFPANGRDVTKIGHYGTGDFELTVDNPNQLQDAYELIRQSYERIGG